MWESQKSIDKNPSRFTLSNVFFVGMMGGDKIILFNTNTSSIPVALTRAKNELYLTYPLMIVDYNRQTIIQKPSRLIQECPPTLFEIWNLEEEAPSFDAPLEMEEKGQEFLN